MGKPTQPPQYQQLAGDDIFEQSSVAESGPVEAPGSEGTGTTVYTYSPIYPRKGKREHVVGIWGKDKRETMELVYKYFPSLLDLSMDRISLQVPAGNEEWAKVTDEAWQRFATKAPEKIQVVVVDTPRDIRRRNFRMAMTMVAAICSPILLLIIFLTIIISIMPE